MCRGDAGGDAWGAFGGTDQATATGLSDSRGNGARTATPPKRPPVRHRRRRSLSIGKRFLELTRCRTRAPSRSPSSRPSTPDTGNVARATYHNLQHLSMRFPTLPTPLASVPAHSPTALPTCPTAASGMKPGVRGPGQGRAGVVGKGGGTGGSLGESGKEKGWGGLAARRGGRREDALAGLALSAALSRRNL